MAVLAHCLLYQRVYLFDVPQGYRLIKDVSGQLNGMMVSLSRGGCAVLRSDLAGILGEY